MSAICQEAICTPPEAVRITRAGVHRAALGLDPFGSGNRRHAERAAGSEERWQLALGLGQELLFGDAAPRLRTDP